MNNATPVEELYCIVSGRVQMVMFRDFTARGARKLQLTGFVRNMPDGTVEIVAQGTRDRLEKLIARIHKGPLLSRVDEVDVTWRQPQRQFDDFRIQG